MKYVRDQHQAPAEDKTENYNPGKKKKKKEHPEKIRASFSRFIFACFAFVFIL